MSKEVDERVVQMRFDNKQFESGVKTTMTTIEKLKQGLRFDGATKGLEHIGAAAKSCDMSHLSGAVETVRVKFSALEVMALTALQNITNSAINTGKQLVKSLTVDQVSAGWSKYAQKTASVQTIMNATGKSIEEVNGYLDKLMWFSDETSYGFTDMTSALGQLTSAGGDIDKLIPMITGIANATAFAGKGASEFSRSIYNLNQSYSAGALQYMDWRSLELAGVASKELKQVFIDTAVAMGKVKEGEITIANFSQTLKDKWADTSVMEAAFGKFGEMTELAYQMVEAGEVATASEAYAILAEQYDGVSIKAAKAAQEAKTFEEAIDATKDAVSSGWMKSFELIFGNYEEAKVLWTDLANSMWDVFASGGEARNEMLAGGLTSGWSRFLKEGISDAEAFKETIIDVAKSHGIAIDDIIENAGSFENSLHEGWLTSDLLSESISTLAMKTRDLSDEELENLGYNREQIDALESLNSAIRHGEIDIKDYADQIGRLSGRENLVKSLWNVWDALFAVSEEAGDSVGIITTLKDAFHEIFPPITSEQLYKLTEGLLNLTEKFKMSEETSNKMKRSFKGVFALLDIGRQAVSSLAKGLSPLLGGFGKLGDGLLDTTANFGDFLVGVNEFIKNSNVFGIASEKMAGFIRGMSEAIQFLTQKIKDQFQFRGFEAFHAFLERVHDRLNQVGEAAGNMRGGVVDAISLMGNALKKSKFMEMMSIILKAVKTIGNGLAKAFGGLADTLIEKLGNADFSGIIDLLNGLSIGGIAIGVNKFIGAFTKPFDDLGSLMKNVTDILDSVRGCFEAYQTQLKAGTLLKIAASIGVLAAAIVAISLIDSSKLSASLGAITVMFADLMGSMAILTKMDSKIKGAAKSIGLMIGMSTAILILASALKTIGGMDPEQMITGLVGIAGLTAMMVAVTKSFGNGTKTVVKGTAQIVIFAAAIKVLASVCEDLSQMKWDGLAKGLIGVGILLTEIAVFLRVAKFDGKAMRTATGIVILSGALKVLASVCKDFASMEAGGISKGLIAIGALLGEIAAFTKLTGNSKGMVSAGISLVAIAAAMKIFASAIGDFGGLDWSNIGKGLLAIGIALVEVTAALRLMPKNTTSLAAGLVIVGASLEIIADVMKKFGGMESEQIAKGLISIGVALAEMVVALNLMKGTMAGSAALVVASMALASLVPTLSLLGSMSIASIAKGLITIAGAFAIIGVAGALLTPLVPAILGLAGSFALIGAAVLGVGVGLLAAGTGLSALAVGIAALATAVAGGATAIVSALTMVVIGIAGLIPAVLTKLGEGIVAFCLVIANSAPALADAVIAVILAVADTLVECVPALVEGALTLLSELLASLANHTPEIVESLMKFLIGLLDGIARNLPTLVMAAIGVLMQFFSGVVDALMGIDTGVLIKAIAGIGLLSGIMLALGAVAGLVPAAMAGVLGMGAVIAEMALVLAAVGALAQIPGLSWLIGEGGNLLGLIGTAIGLFIGGVIGGFAAGATAMLPQVGADLANFMTNAQPFIDGIGKIDSSTLESVEALAGAILVLTASDVLGGLTSWLTGGSSMADFGKELATFGPYFNEYYQSIKDIDGHVVESSANAAKSLSELAANLPKEGGLKSLFTGSGGIEAFGDGLVEFGKSFAKYAEEIKDVNPATLTATTNAAESIAKLGEEFQNGGTWFSNNALSDFGLSVYQFGDDLKRFYNSVSSIDTGTLSGVVLSVNSLVGMIKNMAGVDTKAISEFTMALTSLGDMSVDSMVSAFQSGGISVSAAITSMLNTSLNSVNAYAAKFYLAASTLIIRFVAGAKYQDASLKTAFLVMIEGSLTIIRNRTESFYSVGILLLTNLISGAKSMDGSLKIAVLIMVQSSLTTIRNQYQSFYSAGGYLVEGFANAISDYAYKAASAAKAMASAAARAARKELDEHSPSKVGYQIGDFFGIAFVTAIGNYIDKAYSAGTDIAKSAKDGLTEIVSKISEYLDSDMDFEPQIRPVLDLSNVEQGTARLNTMLSHRKALAIEARARQQSVAQNQNEGVEAKEIKSIQYIQNNYSPKALSRLEIYRQTKNQISAMKGLVTT